jgi:2-methylcitrate dehydratase PrpD
MVSKSQSQLDLGELFAEYAAGLKYDDLSEGAIRAAKQSTLDTLGVILGASGLQDVAPAVAKLFIDWGGKPESTVLAFGDKISAPMAAFVNGSMAHGLDFDDHLPEGHHPSAPLVPALLAIAEAEGGVSGKDFITALAVGQDIFARLRKYVVWHQDWFMTPVVGTFSTAIACAKLLGLSAREILSAIGVASMQSAGTMQVAYGTGGNLRGTYDAYPAKAGVLSAYLARAGVSGTLTPLEGTAGYFEVYFNKDYDRDAMLAGLGKDFQGETLLYKLWPSCGASHGFIDVTMRLLGKPGRNDEIEKIEVVGGDFAKRLSEPIAERRAPASELDAKFSIPYTVALAAAQGSVGVGDFTDEKRADPDITAIAEKITFTEDPRFDWTEELPASAVRITLKNGEVLEGETPHAETPGSTSNPLGWDDIITKFIDCASYAISTRPRERLEAIAARIRELENMDDVATIPRSLA